VPNRRRRRLSTATSAFAALAVASPFAYIAVCDLTAQPAPQHHEFVRAASMTDLPGELMGALTQGLSQFGVSIPPIPSLTGATTPSSLGTPGLGSPDLASPGLTSPGLTSPGLTSPGLTTPGLTSPGLTPGATPGLTTPGLTPGAAPGLTTPGLTPGATPGLATPGLTPGATPGLSTPGLTSPGLTPGLTSPNAFGPATGAGGSELPISDPVGLDPGAGGTYPILGDPNLGAAPAQSGGLVSDMMSAANQLGAGQAIDLLKGMILPGLQQAAHGAAAPVPPPPAPAPIP
jgi:GLTT repeat (6 copies)